MKKFIGFSFNPLRPLNLDDRSKWTREGDTRTYKLISPDLEKDRQFATAHFEVKNVVAKPGVKGYDPSQKLYIAGVANANIVDRVQERLDPVGLDIQNYLKNRQLLAHHSYYHPVGQVEDLMVQEDGVHFTAWIGDPAKGELTDMQREIRSLAAQGILRTVSVGFIPKKIKAPLFGENGELQEPAVIEQWELLELSIVAVPCNQDSVFEVRDFSNGISNAKVITDTTNDESLNNFLIDLKNTLAQDSTEVQTLIFSKSDFTKDEVLAWAKDHKLGADKIDETEDSYRVRQKDPNDFEPDSFRTIDITKGVKAVIGKPKAKDAAAPADAPAAEPGENEELMLLRSVGDMCKKIYDMCDAMSQKMDAKPAADAPAADAPAADAPAADAPAKALEGRVNSIEKGLDRLTQAVKMLVEKTNNK
jgi:hypothetical protein